MASNMNMTENQRDKLISELIRADEPLKVPADLLENIMEKIEAMPARSTVTSYTPPVWLRWGVPIIMVSCAVLAIVFGKKPSVKPLAMDDISLTDSFFTRVNDWFAGLFTNVSFPAISLPDYAIWLGFGSIVLFWGFIGLNHFLNKRLS